MSASQLQAYYILTGPLLKAFRAKQGKKCPQCFGIFQSRTRWLHCTYFLLWLSQVRRLFCIYPRVNHATSQTTIHFWIVPLHVRLARLNLSSTIQLHPSYQRINSVSLKRCPSHKSYMNALRRQFLTE